jgi:hypothetical protein
MPLALIITTTNIAAVVAAAKAINSPLFTRCAKSNQKIRSYTAFAFYTPRV